MTDVAVNADHHPPDARCAQTACGTLRDRGVLSAARDAARIAEQLSPGEAGRVARLEALTKELGMMRAADACVGSAVADLAECCG